MKRSELFFAFLLVPLDLTMILLAFIAAYFWRSNIESYVFSDIGMFEYLRYAFYLLPLWTSLFALNGLYTIKNSSGFLHQLQKIFVASSAAILVLIVLIFVTQSFFFSRLILVFTWALSIAFLFAGRIMLFSVQRYLLARYGMGVRRIGLIGDNQIAERIAEYFASTKLSAFEIIGYFSSSKSEFGLKYLGTVDNLSLAIKKHSIDEIILTDANISRQKMASIIQLCADHKIAFKYLPDVFSLMTSNFQPALIGSFPVMELKPILLDGWGRILKRLADIFFSAVLLILLSPVFLLVAILVKITSNGPVIYSQPRIGRDEKEFMFHKFRSMYLDACDFKGGIKWTTKEDEKTRITPFGKFIRTTNLDELPQLWNILTGDMSFVGPRPEQPKLVARFEQEIPHYFRRHRVKAGLTGWAQVNGLKGDTSVRERVEYDIYYIENWSIWFDIKILFKTALLIINEIRAGKSEYRTRS